METEIAKRVGAAWRNWKRCSGGVVRQEAGSETEGEGLKVYRTVVRPAMERMCGVTRKDKVRNEHIRGTTKVAQATKQITERRLKWHGHVLRRQ